MADEAHLSSFIQSIRRDLNCVTDPDRNTRRNALDKLSKRLVKQDNLPSLEDFQNAWDEIILPVILKAFNDQTEKCREISIHIVTSVVSFLKEVEKTTLQTIPVVVERIGSSPVTEVSEEVRLSLLKLVKSLASRSSLETLSMNLDYVSQVLSISLGDPFHEIKKEVCQIISLIVSRNRDIPAHISERLFKAILPNACHQHFKVRMAILQGINAVMKCNLSTSIISNSLVPVVEALAFDRVERVRKMFFESVAEWLGYVSGSLNFCKEDEDHRERVAQLLPFLLLGIFDESSEVGLASLSLLEEIGRLYALSAQTNVVEKGDRGYEETKNNSRECGDEDISKRFVQYQRILPAPLKARPGMGCRMMVQDFLEELVIPIRKRLLEWTATTRCGAARLLEALLIMTEGKASTCIDMFIPTMCSAIGDDNLSVAQAIVGASHVLGWHVSSEVWLPPVVNHISNPSATSVQTTNGLVIMSALLYGTKENNLESNNITQVVQAVQNVNLKFRMYEAVHSQTLAVVTNLIKSGGSQCATCSSQILCILIQVQCFSSDATLKEAAVDMEETFAHVVGLSSAKQLYETNLDTLLQMATAEHETWSSDSYGQSLFQRLMQNAGLQVGPYMQQILPIFKGCLAADRDPSLRIHLLQLLDSLFEIPELKPCWPSHASFILSDVLIPCGVWQVGKAGAATRHAAMVAMSSFLTMNLCSQETLESLLRSDQLLPVVLSCLEEDYYVDIRVITCYVVENILSICGSVMQESCREKIRNALQKRLDDSNDNVRIRALSAIAVFFSTMPSTYADQSVSSFVSSILLHMDDTNPHIQESVYKALEICTALRPAVVEEMVKNNYNEHQTRQFCDCLLEKASFLQNKQASLPGMQSV